MLFNSIDFVVFLPIVFILYWFVVNKKISQQNLLIVLASYVFYGWWDWRFLLLILLSTVIDFIIGLRIAETKDQKKKKYFLWLSIVVNISLLAFFKYYNFFIESFNDAFSLFGSKLKLDTLAIILPIGISFYTFQTLSYTIDIYRGKLNPTKNFIVFAAFVCFFPQLIAGPIERATHLLPQFLNKRVFNNTKAADGLRQILWGFFKKIVIADSCAEFANSIFNNSAHLNGSTLALGAFFFAFQIYGDFSGYSDIAIGTSKLFGFRLSDNFKFPYFSRDIAEFWRRWHISLSTWFRDYLYIPLGGSKVGGWMKIRNIFVIFLVSGFWHGANWTFIAWGLLNAIYFLPLLITRSNRKNIVTVASKKPFPSLKDFTSIILTFCLCCFAWIFFRANNIEHAFNYSSEILSPSFFSIPEIAEIKEFLILIILIIAFICVEWIGREQRHALAKLGLKWKRSIRYFMYYTIIIIICLFSGNEQEFIYFQF